MIEFGDGFLAGWNIGVADVAFLILPVMILFQRGADWRQRFGTAILVLGLCVGAFLLSGWLRMKGAPDWSGWVFATPLVVFVAWRGFRRRRSSKSFK